MAINLSTTVASRRAPSRNDISASSGFFEDSDQSRSHVKIRKNFEESQFPSLSSSRSRETAREISSGSATCCVVPPPAGTGSPTRNLALMRGRARANRAISGVLLSRSSFSNSGRSNLRLVSACAQSLRKGSVHHLVISQPSFAV